MRYDAHWADVVLFMFCPVNHERVVDRTGTGSEYDPPALGVTVGRALRLGLYLTPTPRLLRVPPGF